MSSTTITLIFLLLHISCFPLLTLYHLQLPSLHRIQQIKIHVNGISSYALAVALYQKLKLPPLIFPPNFLTQFLSFNFLTSRVLSNGNLTGEFPPSIGNLSPLMFLTSVLMLLPEKNHLKLEPLISCNM